MRKIWKGLRANVRKRPESTALPPQIMERVERLHSYHQRSKVMASGAKPALPADPGFKPAPYRLFADSPKIALPASLLDAPTGMLSMLAAGQEAVPDSHRAPPQDLKTLASWLYYAVGETARSQGSRKTFARTAPDPASATAVEIYIAAFGMRDLEPGLYHFCPREFALRQLRTGSGAMLQIRKGRPDLEFLKTLPAAILVAGSFYRAAYHYGRRAYRSMLTDVGQAVQNLVVAGTGLGAQTLTRLRMNDSTLRDLLGVAADEPLATTEAIFAMVAWADPSPSAIELPTGASAPAMPPIARDALSKKTLDDKESQEPLYMHLDCVSPGVAIQQIRPPLTELGPLPAAHPPAPIEIDRDPPAGLSVRQVMLERLPTLALSRNSIDRKALLAINRAAMRGGSFFPLFPEGPHLAMIRPFWIIQDVAGIDRGLWYYHPPKDQWHLLQTNQYRREAKYIAGDRDLFGDSSAVCVLVANLHTLMTQGGPDTYRLAHIEAGIASQRIYLAATSLSLACANAPDYYDEDARAFFGLNKTGWEALAVLAIGNRATK